MQVQLLVVSWAVSWALQPSELSSHGSLSIGVARVYRHRQHTQVGLLLQWASMTASPRHSHRNQMQRPRSIMTLRTPALSRLLPHRLRSTRQTTHTAALASMACSRTATNTVGYRKCKRWNHNLSVSLGTVAKTYRISAIMHHPCITTSGDQIVRFPVTPRHLSLLPLCFLSLCLLYSLPSAASLLPNSPSLCQAGCYFHCCVCCVYKDPIFFLI